MTADEARELTDSVNMEKAKAKIEKYNNLIYEIASTGGCGINTETLSKSEKSAVVEYYSGLGYKITTFLSGNSVGISW